MQGRKNRVWKEILFKGEKMRSGEDSFLYTLTEKFETHCLIMDMQNRILGKTEKVPPNL